MNVDIKKIKKVLKNLSDSGILQNIKDDAIDASVFTEVAGGFFASNVMIGTNGKGMQMKVPNSDSSTYLVTQIEIDKDLCYGVAVDEKDIFIFSYGENRSNAKLIILLQHLNNA